MNIHVGLICLNYSWSFLQFSAMTHVYDADMPGKQTMCTLSNGTDVPVGTEFMEHVCRPCRCAIGGHISCLIIDCPYFFHPVECPPGQELRSVPGQCCRECQGNVDHRLF